MVEDLTYAELLTARFCHDIAGPVGAVSNGVEFLAEDEFNMQAEAFNLVEKSAQEAVARLRFFRQAYGSVSNDIEVNLGHLRDLSQALLKFSKVTLRWDDGSTISQKFTFSNLHGKLILNLLIIVSDTLIYGGVAEVQLGEQDGHGFIRLIAEGKGVKIEDNLYKMLVDGIDKSSLNTHNIQYQLTHMLAKKCGVSINVEHKETMCMLSITLP